MSLTDALVAVDTYSRYPAAVERLPKVGTFLAPNLEAVAALRPTTVLVDDVQGAAGAALGRLGIATLSCSPHTLQDVRATLLRVGQELAPATVDGVVAALDATVRGAQVQATAGRRVRALLIIGRDPGAATGLVAAGPGSWLAELADLAGFDNVLTGSPTRYPKVALDQVLLLAPEVIIDVSQSPLGAAWSNLPMTPAPKIVIRDDAFLLAPSPRVAEAIAVLRASKL